MAFLEVRGIKKSFGQTEVLKGIDFDLEKGEVLAIIGSSGSGKTTLLRCLNFLETADAGSISVGGETLFDADAPKEKKGRRFRIDELREKRLHFGLVFQQFNLFPHYNAMTNIKLAANLIGKEKFEKACAEIRKKARAEIKCEKAATAAEIKELKSSEIAKEDFDARKNALKTALSDKIAEIKSASDAAENDARERLLGNIEQKAQALLDRVGLGDRGKAYPCELSGGQQQRIAIARALALSPDILCFDEPTSALDPELTGEVLKVIKGLKSGDSTMIVVTHEMDFARGEPDRANCLAAGELGEGDAPKHLFENPQNEKTKAFIAKSLESPLEE